MALEFAGYSQAPPNPMTDTTTPIYGGQGTGGGYQVNPNQPYQGQYGTNYSLGQYGQSIAVVANVEHGQPIITNPETGEQLPPGVVPTLRNPNEYYPYQPFEQVQEARMVNKARLDKATNDAIKEALGPTEEFLSEKIKQSTDAKIAGATAAGATIKNESEKLLNNPSGYLTDKVRQVGNGFSGTNKSNGSQATGQSSNPNIGKTGNTASDLGYATGQGIRGIGGAIQGIGKGLTDFGKGIGEGLGLGKSNPDRVQPAFGMTDREFAQQGVRRLDGDFDRRQQQIGGALIDQGFGLKPDLGFLNRNPSDGLSGSLNRDVNFGLSGKLESNIRLNSGGGIPRQNNLTTPDGRPIIRRLEPRFR